MIPQPFLVGASLTTPDLLDSAHSSEERGAGKKEMVMKKSPHSGRAGIRNDQDMRPQYSDMYAPRKLWDTTSEQELIDFNDLTISELTQMSEALVNRNRHLVEMR